MTATPQDLLSSEKGSPSAGEVHEKRWVILAVLVLSLVMVVVANTVLNVALPTLVRDLDASDTHLQWIVDGYVVVFAGLLLTAGALGDRFGRKGVLQTGMVIFGLASVVSAFVETPGQLAIGRAVMGVGAALIMPATLSLLTAVFPPQERGRAIGIWAGFAGAGGAIGPIAGGWLLEHYWWGSTFLVNVPLVVVALVAGHVLLPTYRDPERPIDPIGALLSIVALSSLLFAIIELPRYGPTHPQVAGGFVLASVAIVAFVAWELRVDQPMLDLRLLRDRGFSAANIAIGSSFFAMFGVFFLLTQYLQVVLDYSPLEAGVRTLPMAIGLLVATPMAARLAERHGSRAVIGVGLLLTAFGLIVASTMHAGSGYGHLAASLVIMAAGMGATAAPSTTLLMASVSQTRAGLGSAMNDTTRELGGGLGIAILGSLAVSNYRSALDAATSTIPREAVGEALDGARRSVAAAVDLSPDVAGLEGLATIARGAFSDAMGVAFLVAAAVAVVAAVVVSLLLRGVPAEVADLPANRLAGGRTRGTEPERSVLPRATAAHGVAARLTPVEQDPVPAASR